MLAQPNDERAKYIKTLKTLGLIFIPFLLLLLFINKLSPLQCAAINCAYMMLCIFVKMQLTGNHSLGDEMWSTVPIQYAVLLNNWSPRGILMALFVTVWGTRLSFNLWRKGGFQDLEDYRWQYMKNKYGDTWRYTLYKVLVITVYQCILNLTLALPVYFAPETSLGHWDFFMSILMAGFILLEAVSDQQQWNFQTAKKKLLQEGKLPAEYEIGFLRSGLFKYSRHPNYFAEQGFWWCLYLMTGSLNWSLIGALQLTLIFTRIISLTEEISCSKYPEYSNYQKCTSKLVPMIPNPWPSQ